MTEVTKGEDKGGNDRSGDDHPKDEEALLHSQGQGEEIGEAVVMEGLARPQRWRWCLRGIDLSGWRTRLRKPGQPTLERPTTLNTS